MNKKKLFIFFFLYIIILFSCVSNKKPAIIPVPPSEYFIQEEKINININNITETKDTLALASELISPGGMSIVRLPVWLSAYINGGIKEVEELDAYYEKYVFIGMSEGINLGALKIWADNFSTVQDFTLLAAERIQRRMISTASLYPDDEYGPFFEMMVKKAYSAVYPGVIKGDTYWIRLKTDNTPSHIYNYFVLLIIDKTTMEYAISQMLEEVNSSVTPSGSQRTSINRLRRTFFEGF